MKMAIKRARKKARKMRRQKAFKKDRSRIVTSQK